MDGKLAGITHEALCKMAKSKFDYLVNRKKWGARSPDDDKIVAMAADIKNLKGQLKLNPQLAQLAGGGDEKGDGGKKKGKAKNKKDTSNKKNQKKDKAWKKVPPKDGKPKKKKHGYLTFNWCEHHMAWTVHKPDDCKRARKGRRNRNPLLAGTLRLSQLPLPPPSTHILQP